MIKTYLRKWVRRKNPQFEWDPGVDTSLLLALIWTQAWALLRGLRLLLWGRYPGMLFLGRGVRFFRLGNMRLGHGVQLQEGVYLSAMGTEPLEIGDYVNIGAHSRLVISHTYQQVGRGIKIGHHVGLGDFAHIGGAGGLEIGPECIIGPYFSCHPENHGFSELQLAIRHQPLSRKGINIGRGCWIGAKVTVLDGVEIGEHSVIAAGAVVTRSVPPYSVIAGVPARVIKSRLDSPTGSKANSQLSYTVWKPF